MKQLKFISLALLLAMLSLNTPAADKRPLLMPGKQALFQRVLVVPGGQIHAQPGGTGKPTVPFTSFYVFSRDKHAGGEWLEVGTSRYSDTAGWLKASDTIDWNQGLTVAFREPKEHDRALLFRSAGKLQQIATEPGLDSYKALYQAAVDGDMGSDSPVIAIQPPGQLDIQDDFYLVPILEHRDIYLGNEQARMLRVASVPLSDPKPQTRRKKAAKPDVSEKPRDLGYNAGLAFVIDSTLSMDPYIERTREAVMKIYDSLGDAGLLGNVNFGMIAFRDDPESVPALQYRSKTFVTLEQGRNPGTFLEQINSLKAATVSSRDFREDVYAGVERAIERMSWEGHAARYIVLITDAGPREADDPLSGTGLDAQELSRLASEKGVAIFVMHLLTTATKADHARAAEHYRELSRFPGIGSLYYGVPTGDVEEFGHVLDTLAGQITMQVRIAATGQTQPAPPATQPDPDPEPNPQLAEFQGKIAKLGYALRMRYLRTTEGGSVPRVFNAWLLDHDIRQPEKRTLDVQVLLTRDHLSDLHDILRQVLNTAEEGLLSPDNFLNELKSLAATIARDPEELGETTATTSGEGNSLSDLGFMREYIEDLPYTGEVMNLSLVDWETWPAREQIAFLQRLEDKIEYYRALHDHTDLWVNLDKGPVSGDSVFPIPLEMLP